MVKANLIITKTLIFALLTSLLYFFTPGYVQPASATTYATGLSLCENTNNLSIVESHGKAFYIDSGISPKIDAGYIGYRITNNSGATKTGLWLKLSNFAGGKLSLANSDDQYMQIDDITASGTQTVYVMLKASGSSTTQQSHLVEIFDRRPDLNGATKQTSCRYAFSAVKETIKASANKVGNNNGSATAGIGVSNSSPKLGDTITITVEGETGQIGKGNSPDFDSIWLTPSGVSSWPTRTLKLIDVDIRFNGNNPGGANWVGAVSYSDRLLITGTNGLADVDMGYYVASYTFKVIGKPAANVSVVPVAQIASGTQMKHSDITASGATTTLTFTGFEIPQTIRKAVTASTNLETSTGTAIGGVSSLTYVAVPYEETITSTSASTYIVDEIVDVPSSAAIFYSGSATITDATRTNAALPNPTYISSEANLSPRPLHFIGPFQGSSARTVILRYKMWLPANGNTYSNTAYALIGDQKIGSSSSAIPKVNTTTGNGTGTVTPVTTTESLAPEAVTDPASSVEATTATLNGTVDPNTNAGTIKFHYGTSGSLASYTEVTATTPASGTVSSSISDPTSASRGLTGLSSGTTYFYRVVIDSSTTRLATGDIVSFTTSVPVSAPTVTTNNADSITAVTDSVKVRFNATVNPNNTNIGYLYFEYGTTNNFAVGAGTSFFGIYDEEETTTALTASGPVPTNFNSYVTSGLSLNTTYWYRIVGCTERKNDGRCQSGAGNSQYGGNLVSFSTTSSNQNQTITLNPIENQTYGATGITTTSNSTSKLTVTVTSLTTSVCTISNVVGGADTTTTTTVTIVKVGDCILEATQSGGTLGSVTYNAATAVQRSFNIAPATITITAADKTRTTLESVGSFTATLSAGAAKYSDSISFSSAIYLFSGKGSTSYPTSSTQPNSTTIGTYSITPSSPQLTFTPTAAAENYLVVTVDGTYTITSAVSYTVTFNANFGASPDTSTQSSNITTNLTANSFTRSGFSFAGWAETSTSTTLFYSDRESYSFTSNITLYAIWNAAATSYTFTGPTTGVVNSASTTFTVTPNTSVETTTVVTITFGGTAKGNLETTTVTFAAGTSTAQTFTVTPTVIGDLTLTPTNNRSLENPGFRTYVATGTYTFSGPTSGTQNVESTNFTVTPSATVGNTTIVTITFGGDKGALDTTTVTFTANSNTAQTFRVTPTVVGTLTLTPTNDNSRITNPAARNYVVNPVGTNTVTFNSNSETVTTTTQSSASEIELTLNSFSRTGYSFGGWATASDTTTVAYANGARYGFGASITLYAIWNVLSYTFAYDSNTATSGSAPSGGGSIPYGSTVTVNSNTYSKTDHEFYRWYTTSSGTAGIAYLPTNTFTMPAQNVTLYAIWTRVYTVTIGTLGGGSSSTINITSTPSAEGSSVSLAISPQTGYQLVSGSLVATYGSDTATITGSGPYTFTMPAANVVITANFEPVPAGSYTITINSASGGSGSSSAATVSSGGTVTLTATASTGYTFSGWSCTGGGTLSSTTANPATLSNITSNASCTPTFTQNVTTNNNSGGGGGGGIAPRAQNRIVVSRITNTQAPTVITGQRPVVTGTNTTLTPGNSANRTTTITPTASTATSNTGGVIAVVTNNSSVAATPTTPGQAQINATNTNAGTALEKRENVPASVNIERTAQNGIQVSTTNGWTGRVAVAVLNGDSDSDVESFIEVVVAPTPITAPQINQVVAPPIQRPEERPRPGITIAWNPSQSEVVGYVVRVNSEAACFSMTTSCEITQLIGPKSKVEVLAQGNDNTFSAPVTLPAFRPTKPIPALVVNFAVASSVLSPKFKADLRNLAKVMVKEGFTKVEITGHTDSTGQRVSYDNQRLSDARAKATLNYLKRFVPRLKSVTGAFAFEKRITAETNPEELYTNRRAEVGVS